MTTAVPRCRPFKMVDGMLLIAVAATWLALMRHWWNDLEINTSTWVLPWQAYIGPVEHGIYILLWALIPAYLVMRSLI